MLICVSLVTVVPSNVVNALTITNSVSVSSVTQAKSNWCWAACAEMAGKSVYASSTRSQYSVVYYLKGVASDPYPNVSGYITDTEAGSEYVSYSNEDFRSTSSTWSFSQIATSLGNDNPVLASAGYYSNGVRTGGHVVVIYLTQMIDSSSGTSCYVKYIDPWDGASYYCTFDSFCDGSFNGRIYDRTVYIYN